MPARVYCTTWLKITDLHGTIGERRALTPGRLLQVTGVVTLLRQATPSRLGREDLSKSRKSVRVSNIIVRYLIVTLRQAYAHIAQKLNTIVLAWDLRYCR